MARRRRLRARGGMRHIQPRNGIRAGQEENQGYEQEDFGGKSRE